MGRQNCFIKRCLCICVILVGATSTPLANAPNECGPISWATDNSWVNIVVNFITSYRISYSSAVTSGTSGCKGLSDHPLQQQLYVENRYDQLAEEIAQGAGPHLQALGQLLGCRPDVQVPLFKMSQQHFTDLFAFSHANRATHFLTIIKEHISESSILFEGCAAVTPNPVQQGEDDAVSS